MTRIGKYIHGILLLPGLSNGILPPAMQLAAVRELAVVGWDKQAVFHNLDRLRFPAVERIYFLSDDPCDPDVLLRFVSTGEFRWMLPRQHHRWFLDVAPQHVGYIGGSMERRLRQEAAAAAAAAMPTQKVEPAMGGKWPTIIHDV